MERLRNFNIVLLCIVAITALVQAQNQSGFISIDCGTPENSGYIDKMTGIYYVSDENFTETGVRYTIPSMYITENTEQQFLNVRSFPEGIKNCYTLKLASGQLKFLIRARFMYGNYDDQNTGPSFGLMLEGDEWDSVKIKDPLTIVDREIIHIPKRDYIHVCLVNTNSGTPFISALELRPLPNSTYQSLSGSLLLYVRWDVGTTTNDTVRYKDDAFDRIWWPYVTDDWKPISTTHFVNSTSNSYKPPSAVMRTAARPVNPNDSLSRLWQPSDAKTKYYLYFHFAEVESKKISQIRELNINISGTMFGDPFTPDYLYAFTRYSVIPSSGNIIEFSITKTAYSTLPPILNAIEIYRGKEFSELLTNQQDVDAITNIKSKYEVKRDWQGDPCAPKHLLWQGLNCIYDDYKPPRIISLNLSSSGISGEIIPYIFCLTSIQSLDLSKNSLTGSVPAFLSELKFLRVLNLTGNNLEGSLPDGLIAKAKNGSLTLSVDGNSNLCLSATCKKKNSKFIVPVVASIGSFSVLLAALAILWNFRRREQDRKKGSSLVSKHKKFSYSDVLKITNNFERVLGKGGFGTVYHGYLDDIQVAVKMLSPSSVQGYKQFQAEVELLMRVHHKNLTTLVGYCKEGTRMGLIYEFMANGNLQAHLLEDEAHILSWEGRLRIATEAAQGLEYLHSGCKPPIVHRDVKSANILLNENFQAKLADFGLSKIFPSESGTHVSTAIVGTPGYLDPEYHLSNRLTEKSDVYSFGVVLLELITGQPVFQRIDDKTHISQWASFILAKGDIKKIVDQRLQGDFNINTVWKAVEIAMACVSPTSTKRLTMNLVVTELNDCLAIEIARTKVRGSETIRSNELTMDLNLESEILPIAR